MALIDDQAVMDIVSFECGEWTGLAKTINRRINELPSVQVEQSSDIQDILDYLDTELHPLISPEHWNVYSELHDMISMLPSVQSDDFLEFLWNVINPNKMQEYLEMYRSREEKTNG